MAKIELLIFDMDGLMVDTGRMAYQAYIKSARKHNFEITPDVYYFLTGRTEAGIIAGMKEIYGEDAEVTQWRQSMNEFKQEMLAREQRVYKKNGLIKLLETAKEHQLKLAVASSNTEKNIRWYLEIEQVDHYFDEVISGENVKKGKPDPEIFLAACCQAKVPTEQSIVFEDSLVGIEAAQAAGILSVLVEDNIRDLGGYQGDWKLKKNLSRLHEQRVKSDYQFYDLGQASHFFKAKHFCL